MIKIADLKKYFWSILGAIGVIMFWEGVWGGIGGLPYLVNPWISLGVGILMLSLTGNLFKQYNPMIEIEEARNEMIYNIHKHPEKHLFHVRYHDKIMNKEITFPAQMIKRIEKEALVLTQKDGREIFIPTHRIKEVLYKGKTHWKHEHKEAVEERK